MIAPALDPVYFLLVDDLDENLLALEALLRRDGLVLLKAKSGPQALELLLKHEVALALLDVQMPGMDGFELAELMRGASRTQRVPIIFVTAANADAQRRFRGYEAGAVDFLHKPIETDVLKSKADVFFEIYRQRQQLAFQRDRLQESAEENARLLKESRQYAAALKEADYRKDEFLATLAHELRNPLAPIRNGLYILSKSADKTIAEIREIMERQLIHLIRIIDDLLDVSRVSQGKIDLRRERITLQSILQAAVETSRPLIDAGHHELIMDVPETVLWLDADLTRLAQVVSNLLNNAAKYTPDGGIITLSAHAQENVLVIAISDNGLGIPADMLPKVFELFTQVDHNLDRSQGGLGIGLALVRRLVEMHGGAIAAESAGLGKGSTFTLRLPLAASAPHLADASTLPKALPVAARSLRALVVDDNVASAQTLGWMLELIGHIPALAHNGIEALEMARKLHPDIILLDIGLPGRNGYEVCRELRQDPAFRHTVFIAQTGWGQERDRQQAKDAGFDHHLIKPVNFDLFLALLAEINPAIPKDYP